MTDDGNNSAEQVYFKLFDKSCCTTEIFKFICINLLGELMLFIELMISPITV